MGAFCSERPFYIFVGENFSEGIVGRVKDRFHVRTFHLNLYRVDGTSERGPGWGTPPSFFTDCQRGSLKFWGHFWGHIVYYKIFYPSISDI